MGSWGRGSVTAVLRVTLEIAWWLWIAIGLFVIADALIGMTGGPAHSRLDFLVSFDPDPSAYHIESADLGVTTATISEATGNLVLGTSNKVLTTTWIALVALWMGGWLLVLHKLRATFRALDRGDPFVRGNVARIRFIGIVIIAMEAAQWLLMQAQQQYLNSHFSAVGLSFSTIVRPNLELVFLGLAVLAIAEAFRTGSMLRDEQALTV